MGATAQEESLCRCSSLYFNLDEKKIRRQFYTWHRICRDLCHTDDIIYTPAVTVFKTDTASPVLMEEKDWYDVNVITCAAPDLSEYSMKHYNMEERMKMLSQNDLLKLYEKRWRRILDVAVIEGNEVLVLGVFGCGVFCNDPELVALAAKNVLKDYLFAFQAIEFAIYSSSRGGRNYDVFNRVLESRHAY